MSNVPYEKLLSFGFLASTRNPLKCSPDEVRKTVQRINRSNINRLIDRIIIILIDAVNITSTTTTTDTTTTNTASTADATTILLLTLHY